MVLMLPVYFDEVFVSKDLNSSTSKNLFLIVFYLFRIYFDYLFSKFKLKLFLRFFNKSFSLIQSEDIKNNVMENLYFHVESVDVLIDKKKELLHNYKESSSFFENLHKNIIEKNIDLFVNYQFQLSNIIADLEYEN
jgi:ABC-type multidrug transport system fused ATPase/permease subunit